MSDQSEINIFKALDFIRDHAPKYAKAKAERIYLEEFRKSQKALLMKSAEIGGAKSSATQEREAYADPEYHKHLAALKMAVEEEERLRYLIEAAKVRIEVWRSLQASERFEKSVLGG